MKTSELRIGNYFKEKYSGDLLRIIRLTETGITYDSEYKDDWQAEPITLTKKIMLGIGFVRNGNEMVRRDMILTIAESNPMNDELICLYRDGTGIIKYLHEIQNLYFELNRRELMINI